MPESVINSFLLAELMSISSDFFSAFVADFSDFADAAGGVAFFPVPLVCAKADQVTRQTVTNKTSKRAASFWLIFPPYSTSYRKVTANILDLSHQVSL